MPDEFDPYRKWLGIPPQEQPPHHYRLLGIAVFEDDPDVISNAADRQMSHVRTYQSGKNGALSQQLLNELSAAKVCLLDSSKKTDYDDQLKAQIELDRAPEQPIAQAPSVPPPLPRGAAPPQAAPPGPAPPPVNGTMPENGPVGLVTMEAPAAPTPRPTPLAQPATAYNSPSAVAPEVVSPALATVPDSSPIGVIKPDTQHTSLSHRRRRSSPLPLVLGLLALGGLFVLALGVALSVGTGSGEEDDEGEGSHSAVPHERASQETAGRRNGDRGRDGDRNNRPSPDKDRTAQKSPEPDDGESPVAVDPPDSSSSSKPDVPEVKPPKTDPPQIVPEDPADNEPPRRAAVPAADALRAVRRQVASRYRAEIAAANDPTAQRQLLAQLIGAADEQPAGSPMKYAIYEKVRDLTLDMAEPEAMLFSIDALADEYEMDALAEKAAYLNRAIAKASSSKGAKNKYTRIGKQAIDLEREAIEQHRYDMAQRLTRVVQRAARAASEIRFVRLADEELERLEEFTTAEAKFGKAATELRQRPDDPVANLAVGRFFCFYRGEWERGLPMMARGSDVDLGQLAELELGDSSSAEELAELADGWFKIARRKGPIAQFEILQHARQLYEQALPELRGSERAEAQERLREIETDIEEGPGLGVWE